MPPYKLASATFNPYTSAMMAAARNLAAFIEADERLMADDTAHGTSKARDEAILLLRELIEAHQRERNWRPGA